MMSQMLSETASSQYLQNAIADGGSVRGINAKGQGTMPRKKIDALVAFVKDYGAKGLAYIAIQPDGSYQVFICKIYER